MSKFRYRKTVRLSTVICDSIKNNRFTKLIDECINLSFTFNFFKTSSDCLDRFHETLHGYLWKVIPHTRKCIIFTDVSWRPLTWFCLKYAFTLLWYAILFCTVTYLMPVTVMCYLMEDLYSMLLAYHVLWCLLNVTERLTVPPGALHWIALPLWPGSQLMYMFKNLARQCNFTCRLFKK